jgi:hypothetical protein
MVTIISDQIFYVDKNPFVLVLGGQKERALSNSQMCIVTGPRIDLAINLIDRMKNLFEGSIYINQHLHHLVLKY